jgi:phage regulator Rha-like protein
MKQKYKKIEKFIQAIQSMGGDYIYVTDINTAPCVTAKKEEIRRKIKNINLNKVVIVIKEIESWYLAGINEKGRKKIKNP